MSKELLEYGENIYSQAGEDGILAEVFRRLRIRGGDYVDIGAHNGRFMSNTERLRECGWAGLCVDSDSAVVRELKDCLSRSPVGNRAVCVTVSADNVAELADWPQVDFLDLDVDGPELQIWRALPNDGPAVVLVEIDPADPLGTLREHSTDKRLSSFSSMVALGESKGYRLISYTGLNCLFVQSAMAQGVADPVPEADSLYLDGASCAHYRKLVKMRSDARARLRDWSHAYH